MRMNIYSRITAELRTGAIRDFTSLYALLDPSGVVGISS